MLQQEILYKGILEDIESTGKNENCSGKIIIEIIEKLLTIDVTGQPNDVQYWRVVIPDDFEVNPLLVTELHAVPYSTHLGVQTAITTVCRYFW